MVRSVWGLTVQRKKPEPQTVWDLRWSRVYFGLGFIRFRV